MSLLLGKVIYLILSGDTNIHSYVQDKIYPIFAPDETLNPFIVYNLKTNNVIYTKDGLVYDEVSLNINVVSDNYVESISIAQIVRNLLERKVFSHDGIDIYECLVASTNEDYGVDGYITTIEFAIKSK